MSDSRRAGAIVAARIHSIAPNPAELSAPSRAALASLRRGVGKPPGSVPEIWQFTLVDTDGGTAAGDRRELAVHVALTQWAMHQQSKLVPMHRPDRSFGEALRLLASGQNRSAPQESAAYRRMMALAAGRNLTAITTHARGLISQLRAAGHGFDYARWADDLELLQVPGRAPDVQRRWGRDFYRLSDERVGQILDSQPEPTTADHSEGAAR